MLQPLHIQSNTQSNLHKSDIVKLAQELITSTMTHESDDDAAMDNGNQDILSIDPDNA